MEKVLKLVLMLGMFAVAPLATAGADAVVGKAALGATPFANTEYGSGVVHGKAHLVSEPRGNETRILLRLEGLRPGSTHMGHIHNGTCARLFPGTILFNLEPLVANAAGVATSQTLLNDTLAGLPDCEWWVAVHEGSENTNPQTPAIAVGPVMIQRDAGR